MYYNASSSRFTADRFSVKFYPSNLLSDQPPYFCIRIYFFLSISKILVNDSLMRASEGAGVVVLILSFISVKINSQIYM